MNQLLPVRLSREQVCEFLGIEAGSMSALAWLLIQHEGQGLSRQVFVEKLGVPAESVDSLVRVTIGIEVRVSDGTDEDAAKALSEAQQEAETRWSAGVIALKGSALGGEQRIARGWDDIEAMAVEKLGNHLANMKTDGAVETILTIAKAANSATRRAKGEGARGSGGNIGVSVVAKMGDSGGEVELQSGNLGSITLRLSPKIQEQLARPDRVIDAVANKATEDRTSTQNLEMLRLKDTRALAEAADSDESLDRIQERSKAAADKEARRNQFGNLREFVDE